MLKLPKSCKSVTDSNPDPQKWCSSSVSWGLRPDNSSCWGLYNIYRTVLYIVSGWRPGRGREREWMKNDYIISCPPECNKENFSKQCFMMKILHSQQAFSLARINKKPGFQNYPGDTTCQKITSTSGKVQSQNDIFQYSRMIIHGKTTFWCASLHSNWYCFLQNINPQFICPTLFL